MECNICRRVHDPKRLPFLCATDGRNQLYEPRIRHVQVLLETDALRNQLQDSLKEPATPSNADLITLKHQQMITEEHTTKILDAANKLRDDISTARAELQERRAALSRRKSDLAAMADGSKERRLKLITDQERAIATKRFNWSQSAESMAGTRAFLGAEAANLYGLKRVARKGSRGAYDYYVGRVPVLDLVSMNSSSPEQITTSLGHIVHILLIATYYFSIRLPAEITPPHRDYPFPTILSLSNSYRHAELPFPGNSGPTTPTALAPGSDTTAMPLPHARPLYVSKPLPQLLREDPAAYSYFLEGVALLAYNIAWLCSTQGIMVGEKNPFDEVCQIGRNLYNLLIQRNSAEIASLPVPGAIKIKNASAGRDSSSPTWIGRYSHGTMYYFLGGPEGTELIKSFRLPSPLKLADKLRRKLIGDAAAPDWEVLEDEAWKVDEAPDPTQATTVETKATTSTGLTSTSRGWTKVK
ncbi:UV radiation resistance protein and autophagy-related subunit 14-domain-containing protein [Emericellopsis atlantica]|uniref:Autophagy-related protein 14 n=1 Tax=Emericellopsis atlantica TaxID=2614577 RepID=A0A9P7ZPK5_9HYPO|nr:UV radiation resistance protein and autophagy-related subunit 14-domain-containing protein [Emericellopsis atlantica]KAG9255949.1 UV radiation resistance protein and autophagy-related subunit 14-domain-containing protein [Emericellopsis atlantica]